MCFLCCSGRFQQLEILNHVTNAFSSLLNDVAIPQNKTQEKSGGWNVQGTSVSGMEVPQRRMENLTRRTSRQTIERNYNAEAPESFRRKDNFFTPSVKPEACGAELSAASNRQTHVSPSAENQPPQANENRITCHPSQRLLGKQWPHSLQQAKQISPSCGFEGSAKERMRKENLNHYNQFKNWACLMDKQLDSYEMEEVSAVPKWSTS